ncbi:MAG TPA: hypothetical protein PKL81_12410 [Ferruginibacter sp.]|nr:hypothetical protein [Ferruginibacter sp.]
MATVTMIGTLAAVKTTNQEITDGMINVETGSKRMVIAEALNAEMRSTGITGIQIAGSATNAGTCIPVIVRVTGLFMIMAAARSITVLTPAGNTIISPEETATSTTFHPRISA